MISSSREVSKRRPAPLKRDPPLETPRRARRAKFVPFDVIYLLAKFGNLWDSG
jgi:hypothetical protein